MTNAMISDLLLSNTFIIHHIYFLFTWRRKILKPTISKEMYLKEILVIMNKDFHLTIAHAQKDPYPGQDILDCHQGIKKRRNQGFHILANLVIQGTYQKVLREKSFVNKM